MKSGKERSITFLATADSTSVVHRCFMISRELESRGYNSNCLLSGTYLGRAPNLVNHIKKWKLILNLQPDILVLHRSSNVVDHEMIKRMKKLGSGTRIIFDYDDAIFHTRLPG